MSPPDGPNQSVSPQHNMASNAVPCMMKGNSDIINCQDLFPGEPPSFSKSNSMLSLPEVLQQNMPNTASPVQPLQYAGMNPKISFTAPASSVSQPPDALSPASASSELLPAGLKNPGCGAIDLTAKSTAVTSTSMAEPVPASSSSAPPTSVASQQNMSGLTGMSQQSMSSMQGHKMSGMTQGSTSTEPKHALMSQHSMGAMLQVQNTSSQKRQILNFPLQGDMPIPSANMPGPGYRDSSALARTSTPNVITQRPPSNISSTSSMDSQSGDLGSQQPISGSGNRQFPFDDQFPQQDRLVIQYLFT